MERYAPSRRTRRAFLRTLGVIPAALGLASGGKRKAMAQGKTLLPTPACSDHDDVTPAQTEGPYYKRNSPQRTSLLDPGISGTKIVITGLVLATDCQPIVQVLVDFWQADAQGVYDNGGYRLRGYQFTDAAGRYALETVMPGRYPGRTRHVHVKVQAPNQPVLTTQLYFPGEPRNATDWLFKSELLLTMQDTSDGKAATFNFVLNNRPQRTRARSEQG